MKMHSLVEMVQVLFAKCEPSVKQNLLLVQVWTEMSLVQPLRSKIWKEDQIWWRGIDWLKKNQIFNSYLIFDDKNDPNFNNFYSIHPKIVV
jgi:hypothetical protein